MVQYDRNALPGSAPNHRPIDDPPPKQSSAGREDPCRTHTTFNPGTIASACGDVDEAADAIVPGLKVVWVRHGSSRPALDCFDGGSSIGISNQGSVIRDQVHCHSFNLRYLITDT